MHKNLTFNYQHYLLKKFKINFFNKYKFYKLPKNVLLEKFIKKIYKFKIKGFKQKLFKLKYIYLNKKPNKIIYNKLYKLYNYWNLNIIYKLYNIIYKLYLNLFLEFCYLRKLNFLKHWKFIFNFTIFEAKNSYNLINLNYKNFLFKLKKEKNYYINLLKIFKNDKNSIFKNLEKINNNIIYFKIRNNYKITTNFFNENNYSIIINFKKSIIQTARFINFYLSKKVNELNLNNTEYTFMEIDQYLLNFNKIKFNKMNLNHRNLGYLNNIKEIFFKNYELIENDDKKLYYI